jgi:hypothetical protein
MFEFNNGSCATQKLDSSSVATLMGCPHLSFGNESGWTIVYGKDSDKKMVIAVHAHSMEDIECFLYNHPHFKAIAQARYAKGRGGTHHPSRRLKKNNIRFDKRGRASAAKPSFEKL